MLGVIVVVLVSYVAGAMPFSYWAGKVFAGIDLREHGSGNLGASNAFRALGVKVASLVLVGDIAKGFFPVFLAPVYAPGPTVSAQWLMIVAAFATIIGHMFSFFVNFRGGKGAATTAGAFAALAPWAMLGTFIVWLTVMVTTRIVSLASIVGALALPIIVYVAGRMTLGSSHWSLLVLSFLITIVVIAKHKSNIKRLFAGQERTLQREK